MENEHNNAADEDDIELSDKEAKAQREEELKDLRDVLKLKAGRKVLWRYLEECGVFTGGFVPDPNRVYFNEGMRNIGNIILLDVNEAAPETLMNMKKEFQGESNAR